MPKDGWAWYTDRVFVPDIFEVTAHDKSNIQYSSFVHNTVCFGHLDHAEGFRTKYVCEEAMEINAEVRKFVSLCYYTSVNESYGSLLMLEKQNKLNMQGRNKYYSCSLIYRVFWNGCCYML